jgi:hypothetical protein
VMLRKVFAIFPTGTSRPNVYILFPCQPLAGSGLVQHDEQVVLSTPRVWSR